MKKRERIEDRREKREDRRYLSKSNKRKSKKALHNDQQTKKASLGKLFLYWI